ncbi:unnamed protein product [marine sediment metagenome]|uniref:Uncharacterized protein n=1 Tax=marine sediment metagenome TaxID=412755 RepID=X0VRQ2_9ZZZZ
MKSKEAVRIIDKYGIELPTGCAAEIVNLILELQKYKDMDGETRDKFNYIEQMNFPVKRYTYENIMSVMNEIKEKYFPKPKPEDVADRYILNKIEEAIKNFLQDIYHIRVEREVKERNKKGGISC